MSIRWRTIQSRLVRLIGTLWLIVTAAFVCAYALPGDPARMILGQRATTASIAAFRRSAGLDEPVATQYARFVQRAARLDLGDSLVQRRPVTSLLRERGYQTLTLLVVATLLLVTFGIIVPIALQLIDVGASRPRRAGRAARGSGAADAATAAPGHGAGADSAAAIGVRGGSVAVALREAYAAAWTLAAVAPPYVLSIVALLLVAVRLSLVPVTFEPGRVSAWILPAAVLAAYPIAVTIRLLNEQIARALQAPYVTTARALGYSERDVLLRFALPNALTPAMAALANGLAFFVTGSFFVEVVFGIGGWGTLAYEAVRNKDIAVLVGVTIIFGAAICAVSALLQLTLIALDPRAIAREGHG
jgi:ABC-type dipeptide/oligopeptide/nickel transport system permease component